MNNKHITSTNVTFDFLKGSSEFLNIILNNLTSSILLLNKNMELQAFNDSIKHMFTNSTNEELLYKRCGEAIGCANTIEEMADCGKTSKCKDCDLRILALQSYAKKEAIYKSKMSREFYKKDGTKEMKHLQFSIFPFYFEDDYYIVLIVEDITELIDLRARLN